MLLDTTNYMNDWDLFTAPPIAYVRTLECNAERKSPSERKKITTERSERKKPSLPTRLRSLPTRVLESECGQFAIEWLETPEEDAASRVIRSADCYRQYSEECALWGCEALSARRFAMLAMGYVDAFTGKGGVRWYRFKDVQNLRPNVANVREFELNVRNAA